MLNEDMKRKVNILGAMTTSANQEKFRQHAGFDAELLPACIGGKDERANTEVADCLKVPVGAGSHLPKDPDGQWAK